jgi:hypothetical protein
MNKKSLKGGINSLLGETPQKPKRGRPVTQTKEVVKSSQEGTLEGEVRATYIVREQQVEAIKCIAYWERKKIKDVVVEALDAAIKAYEKKNGKIKAIPNK